MSKYDPLRTFLGGVQTIEVPMTFDEIEHVIGTRLPAAAENHRAWWSNNSSNNVMTKAWLAAGYSTERVDMSARRLVFRRNGSPPASPTSTSTPTTRPKGDPGFLERIRARLGGTVTVAEGVDLTEPTGEIWDAES